MEEKPLLVPKVEPKEWEAAAASISESTATGTATAMTTTGSASVKVEVDMDVGVGKSADYDECLEIQKELGLYASTELGLGGKCRSKSGKHERGRANGDTRSMSEASASELERDLLEDTGSLDGLALYAQAQCPTQPSERNSKPEEHDDITAQVQSAIDSILNLKKRPAAGTSQSGSSQGSSSDSNDKLLDQAVRSILGS